MQGDDKCCKQVDYSHFFSPIYCINVIGKSLESKEIQPSPYLDYFLKKKLVVSKYLRYLRYFLYLVIASSLCVIVKTTTNY